MRDAARQDKIRQRQRHSSALMEKAAALTYHEMSIRQKWLLSCKPLSTTAWERAAITKEIAMKKLLLLSGLLLALGSGAAHATTWTFMYQGFEREGAFDPDYRLTGSFTASDLDLDNVIEMDELTSFVLDGRVYVGPDNGSGIEYTARSFSYTLTGALQFSTRYFYGDEALSLHGETVSGDYILETSSHIWTGEGYWRMMRWTDATTFTISPAPAVPEPTSFAMLGVGTLLLGARQWRRRRSHTA